MARTADPNLRQNILTAARDVFKREGFSAARMSDIAQQAGVAVGSIYLHFKTKEALVSALSDVLSQRILRESLPLLGQANLHTAIADTVRSALHILEEEQDLLKLLYLNIGFGAFDSFQPSATDFELLAQFSGVLQARMTAGEMRRYDPAQVVQLISNLVERTAVGCLILGAGKTEDVEATLIGMLTHALVPDVPRASATKTRRK